MMTADPCSWLHRSYLKRPMQDRRDRHQRTSAWPLHRAVSPALGSGRHGPVHGGSPADWGAVEKLGAIVELVQISYPDYSNHPKKVSQL
jgi:hypothetical protein